MENMEKNPTTWSLCQSFIISFCINDKYGKDGWKPAISQANIGLDSKVKVFEKYHCRCEDVKLCKSIVDLSKILTANQKN